MVAPKPMRLIQGQHWRCMNDACRAEIRVTGTGGLGEGSNPRCSCGSIMKRPYHRPRFEAVNLSEKLRSLLENGTYHTADR